MHPPPTSLYPRHPASICICCTAAIDVFVLRSIGFSLRRCNTKSAGDKITRANIKMENKDGKSRKQRPAGILQAGKNGRSETPSGNAGRGDATQFRIFHAVYTNKNRAKCHSLVRSLALIRPISSREENGLSSCRTQIS